MAEYPTPTPNARTTPARCALPTAPSLPRRTSASHQRLSPSLRRRCHLVSGTPSRAATRPANTPASAAASCTMRNGCCGRRGQGHAGAHHAAGGVVLGRARADRHRAGRQQLQDHADLERDPPVAPDQAEQRGGHQRLREHGLRHRRGVQRGQAAEQDGGEDVPAHGATPGPGPPAPAAARRARPAPPARRRAPAGRARRRGRPRPGRRTRRPWSCPGRSAARPA